MASHCTRANESPPGYHTGYSSVQGEDAPLLRQYQDGSDGPKTTHRAKYTRLVIAIGCASIALAILLVQPCLHTLQRQSWANEIAAHDKLMEDRRQNWAQEEALKRQRRADEISAHDKLMEDHRRHWDQEEGDHARRRAAHTQEQQKWTVEKAELEQWQADLERKRGDIIWGDYRDLGCSKYSKRSHSATLDNVPAGLDPRKECERKSIYLNDQWVLPSWCEDPQLCGKMVGHWEVDSSLCKPYIAKYENYGCIRPATRKYKGKLENIQDVDNWHKICMTMSGFYDGVDLGHPDNCSACRSGRCGYWAEWTIEDHTCR